MSTVAKSTKKITSKKAIVKKTPVAPKNGGTKNDKGKAAVLALRTQIVKTWPNVPSVESLEKSSGLPKTRVLMYKGSITRTLKLAHTLGRLK